MELYFHDKGGSLTGYYIYREPPILPLKWEGVREHYGENVKYLGSYATRTKGGGWSEIAIDTFFQPEPDFEAGHSHFFGLYSDPFTGHLMVTNMEKAFGVPYDAIIANDGQILYSEARHDYRVSQDKSVFIDGGRDYSRHSMVPKERICDLNFYLDGRDFYVAMVAENQHLFLNLTGGE